MKKIILALCLFALASCTATFDNEKPRAESNKFEEKLKEEKTKSEEKTKK
jgi:hypothetical protein